jgi:hypothetical protein
MYQLGALQSVPLLIEKFSIFSCTITGGLINGKQGKDGTNGTKRVGFYLFCSLKTGRYVRSIKPVTYIERPLLDITRNGEIAA